MGSRQASLIKKGYLAGLLTFEYKYPTSKLREQHLLNALEDEIFVQSYISKALIEASLSSGVIALQKGVAKIPFNTFDKAMQIELPYHYKKDIVVDAPSMDMASWKKFIDEKQKLLNQTT